jgi:hypothetical protein
MGNWIWGGFPPPPRRGGMDGWIPCFAVGSSKPGGFLKMGIPYYLAYKTLRC